MLFTVVIHLESENKIIKLDAAFRQCVGNTNWQATSLRARPVVIHSERYHSNLHYIVELISNEDMDGQFDDADDVGVTPKVEVTEAIVEDVVEVPVVKPKKVKKSKAAKVAVVEEIISTVEGDDWNADEEDADFSFDALESMLLNDGSYTGGAKGSMVGTDFGKKINLSTRVENDITRSEKKGEKRVNDCGKDDRATSEQVLDPRTRLILFKLLNNGFLSAIDGCLSTGKEANVYYAKGEQGQEYAVKIFKTSILVFKDRDRYVSGEYRFRNGYCKSNPRKMVQTWAEKEMRNLKRLVTANVPCPTPHLLKSHVLVMDFLGKDGWCAPRLKEATLDADQVYRLVSMSILHLKTSCLPVCMYE